MSGPNVKKATLTNDATGVKCEVKFSFSPTEPERAFFAYRPVAKRGMISATLNTRAKSPADSASSAVDERILFINQIKKCDMAPESEGFKFKVYFEDQFVCFRINNRAKRDEWIQKITEYINKHKINNAMTAKRLASSLSFANPTGQGNPNGTLVPAILPNPGDPMPKWDDNRFVTTLGRTNKKSVKRGIASNASNVQNQSNTNVGTAQSKLMRHAAGQASSFEEIRLPNKKVPGSSRDDADFEAIGPASNKANGNHSNKSQRNLKGNNSRKPSLNLDEFGFQEIAPPPPPKFPNLVYPANLDMFDHGMPPPPPPIEEEIDAEFGFTVNMPSPVNKKFNRTSIKLTQNAIKNNNDNEVGFDLGLRKVVVPNQAPDEKEDSVDRSKSAETFKTLKDVLTTSVSLGNTLLDDLDNEAVEDIVRKMYRVEVLKPHELLWAKDVVQDTFYISEKGTFEMVYETADEPIRIKRGPRGFFGEMHFRYDSLSNFSVYTTGPCVLWALSRRDYSEVLKASGERFQNLKLETLLRVQVFKQNLNVQELNSIASALEFKFVLQNVTILDYGHKMFEMIFVTQGQVDVYFKSDNGEEIPLVKITKGEYFGDFALFESVPSKYRLVSASPKTVFLSLNFDELEGLLGGLKSVIDKKYKERILNDYKTNQKEGLAKLEEIKTQQEQLAKQKLTAIEAFRTTVADDPHREPVSMTELNLNEKGENEPDDTAGVEIDDDFMECPALMRNIRFRDIQLVTILGRGNFGKVFLARYNINGKPTDKQLELQADNSDPNRVEYGPRHFALKIMSRYYIAKHGWEEKVDNETSAMAEISYFTNSNFVLKLFHSFSCPRFVYLLIEYGEGGDLYHLMRSQPGSRFHETACRYYIASVINGIDVLHQRGILYRDLKPENLIINKMGHLKVADLGLAKKTRRTYTNCGTPDYTAPEIIRGKGHDHACDWWAVGVLVFELHAGTTPFYADSTDKIYENILKHKTPIAFIDSTSKGQILAPGYGYLAGKSVLSNKCKDLIAQLLIPKTTLRLGMSAKGAQAVRDHEYFMGKNLNFSWEDLNDGLAVAPFVPEVSIEDDPDIMERDSSVQLENVRKDNSKWEPKVNSALTQTPTV